MLAGGTSPASEGAANGEAQVVGSGQAFQVWVEGRCAAVRADGCVFVPEKGALLDVDGKVIRELALETVMALLDKISASGYRGYSAPEQKSGPIPIP